MIHPLCRWCETLVSLLALHSSRCIYHYHQISILFPFYIPISLLPPSSFYTSKGDYEIKVKSRHRRRWPQNTKFLTSKLFSFSAAVLNLNENKILPTFQIAFKTNFKVGFFQVYGCEYQTKEIQLTIDSWVY